MSPRAFVLLVTMAGCGGGHHERPDAASSDTGALVMDAPDVPLTPSCPAGSLSPEGPAAFVVEGDVTLTRFASASTTPMVRRATATIWFPSGRVAGAPAFLSYDSWWPHRGPNTQRSIVTTTGAVTFSVRGYYLSTELTGTLHVAAGANELVLDAERWNMSTTDRREDWEGSGTLCASAESLAEPTLHALDHSTMQPPTAPIWLGADAPIDPEHLSIEVTAGGEPWPATAEWSGNAVEITAEVPFPPGAPIRLDVTGTLDVMGRPVDLVEAPVALATTAVVTDHSLDTPPDPGALAGRARWADGSVVFERAGWSSGLLAIGDLPGETLVLSTRLVCNRDFMDAVVIDADGDTSAFTIPCERTSGAEVRVVRPGIGPLWITVWSPDRSQPQFGPPPFEAELTIDAIEVEP